MKGAYSYGTRLEYLAKFDAVWRQKGHVKTASKFVMAGEAAYMASDTIEITHQGKTFEMDEDGFIVRFEDWCPEWVDLVRESEGIAEITEQHTTIINFIQEYYKRNGIAPMVRVITKSTGFKLKEVYELFPSGPARGACRMAGLPSPTGCV